MNTRKHTKFVHEGKYVAEVDIEIIDTADGWSPYLSLDDALKIDDLRYALKKEDISAANKIARVYELTRVNKAA
jgi:hypothetical protein